MYFRTKAMANMAPETVAVNPAKSLINSTMKTSQWVGFARWEGAKARATN